MLKDVTCAAFSQIDITPEFQTSLVGFYRPDSRSQGVQHRLYAQTILFQTKNESFCLITIDNLGLTIPLARIVRTKVSKILNTDISHVMLNFSHTHSAPEPTPYALNGEKYFDFLCVQIVQCVITAKEKISPCKVSWALTEADIGENRRDGCIVTDNRLGALMVSEANSSKPIVMIMRIAAHANVLKESTISSDFIGVAREKLQRFLGYPVMVLQGAAGNLKPLGVPKIGGGSLDDICRISDILVSAAQKLQFTLQDIYDIRMFSREMTFIADVPTKEEADSITAYAPWADATEWLYSCEELRNRGQKTQELTAEINFFVLNQGCICGVAEEIFCELALDAKERTGNPLFFLNGYTNGCTGYLPSRTEWHKGGYEVLFSNFIYHKYHGHVMPYRAETADQIVDLVVNGW
ncbi:MAG: alkaline ceramidase [Ruminiclostridium sp.]|nr:alkaline ceramidase [Ruminiclostridium sp.]